MSGILDCDEIDDIERYIPSGNPDAFHVTLRKVIASHRVLQAKVRTLEQERDKYRSLLVSQCELQERLDRAEQERDQWQKSLHSLTPGGSEFANDPSACVEWIRKTRSGQHNTILALKRERDQLRARVERLESALRHIAEARWSPRTTASYDEDARYAYPERESYVRQYAQRALAGKEEHGTKSND